MRLSGVDPGIIRELSGIYKPFVKAFKELISNAYDADAKRIVVTLTEDFADLEVADDGNGMTPYDFQESFARLGGSTAWLRGGRSPGGRLRIGYKGIGFLAVARYCGALQVETHSRRPFRGQHVVTRRNRKSIPFGEIVGELIPENLLKGKITVTAVRAMSTDTATLKLARDYFLSSHSIRLFSPRALRSRQLEVDYLVDCKGLTLEATLNFDYLLGLERKADLRQLDNFCSIVFRDAPQGSEAYTRVRLHKLKDFVVRDLSAPRAKGKARNVVFKSGKEQFFWRLARTAPIEDDSAPTTCESIAQLAALQGRSDLPSLILKWRSDEPVTLRRPIYAAREAAATRLDETLVPVSIDEGGLCVTGYLLARSEILYPAELRGISIRVRNVAIGDASYLGWEHILSGPRKAALSQITGELIVLKGLDASDAINPGRESFYEENTHYRILRRVLFGSEETIGGLVGEAVRSILDRIRVRSQVTDAVAGARARRKTLVDISSAVNFYSRGRTEVGNALNSFFSRPVRANGLAMSREVQLRPAHKLGGFEIETAKGLAAGELEIDFARRRILIDFDQDLWSTTVYLNGHYYEVSIRQGKPEHPICEFDNERKRIYVNWGHPVKLHMDDAAFLKSAILLRLAHHAAADNGDAMMDLALNMLAFRAE